MLLGCIADDFTGASDLANTLAKGSMSTMQFVGVPEGVAPTGCEAGVVALKTRSIAATDAVAQSLAALDWLKAQGCRQFLLNAVDFEFDPARRCRSCSGGVAPCARGARGGRVSGIPTTGRTLSWDISSSGPAAAVSPAVEKHPLDAMTDPDLRHWLRLQSKGEIGFITHETVRRAPTPSPRCSMSKRKPAGVDVVDAIEDQDLLTIRHAMVRHELVTGGYRHRPWPSGELP